MAAYPERTHYLVRQTLCPVSLHHILLVFFLIKSNLLSSLPNFSSNQCIFCFFSWYSIGELFDQATGFLLVLKVQHQTSTVLNWTPARSDWWVQLCSTLTEFCIWKMILAICHDQYTVFMLSIRLPDCKKQYHSHTLFIVYSLWFLCSIYFSLLTTECDISWSEGPSKTSYHLFINTPYIHSGPQMA